MLEWKVHKKLRKTFETKDGFHTALRVTIIVNITYIVYAVRGHTCGHAGKFVSYLEKTLHTWELLRLWCYQEVKCILAKLTLQLSTYSLVTIAMNAARGLHYLRRRLASEGIVMLGVTLSRHMRVCVCVRRAASRIDCTPH